VIGVVEMDIMAAIRTGHVYGLRELAGEFGAVLGAEVAVLAEDDQSRALDGPPLLPVAA
jgi:hypothetical protein